MPISYPLTLPTSPTARSITIRKRSVVGVDASPFSLQPQTYAWAGQLWMASVQLPPMARANAEAWVAALVSLNGQEGSFLLGDTANLLPRGVGLSAALISASPAIANGGFETAGGGGQPFGSWTKAESGGSTVTRDTTVFDTGAASCKFTVDSSNNDAAVSQGGFALGRRLRVEIRARNDGGAAGVRVANPGQSEPNTGPLTTSFADYSFDLTTTNSTLYLGRHNAASQSVWVDSIRIYDLDTYGALVNGAGQTGTDLVTDGWLASQTGILKAGDWIQLGSGSTARLHKVLVDADSNGSGQATLTLWPRLRSSPADNAAITVSSPRGRFMLASDIEWSIDEAKIYGLSFEAVEDLRP